MLVSLAPTLRKAARGHYAVGAFNVSDLEQVQAVILAAVTMKSPVIVNVSEKALDYAGVDEITAVVTTMAKKVKVPVVLNLDHGRDVKAVRKCIFAGFSGIMYDGSRLPYRVNTNNTKAVVSIAHRRGIGVEGEIGAVSYPKEKLSARQLAMTDPGEAVEFVRRTGVDALAVAIGNTHGLPRPGEKLDFTVLKNIHNRVRVPLVLHGASGTPAADIRRAIALGIAKINIDTDLRLAFMGAVRHMVKIDRTAFDPRHFLAPAREAVMATVMKKMDIFGSKRQA